MQRACSAHLAPNLRFEKCSAPKCVLRYQAGTKDLGTLHQNKKLSSDDLVFLLPVMEKAMELIESFFKGQPRSLLGRHLDLGIVSVVVESLDVGM
jgi:hypothetical protein